MTDRRRFILAAASLVLTPGFAQAQAITGGISARRAGGAPKMIKGKPNRLDFGGGLVVPMDSTIFGVLWEGRDRWITYGRAAGANRVRAMANAQLAADATMQLMLLTLAFQPDRLEKIEGSGWRLKSRDTKDLVLGKIALPGKPLLPTTDVFSSDGLGVPSDPELAIDPMAGGLTHALTGFIVLKKEVDLDDVRRNARLLDETQAAAAGRG